jgi:plastocyanin
MVRRLSSLVVLAVLGAVLLAPGVAAGGLCHPDPGTRMKTSSRPAVTVDRCAFLQTVTYVDPGETVRWVNEDVYPHTVTGAAEAWGDDEMLDRGDEVSYAFENEGVYPYYCALHPTMVGAVVVGDGGSPAAAAGAGVSPVDDAAPASATDTAPADSDDGLSPVLLALAIALALGGVATATRLALTRRASTASAS